MKPDLNSKINIKLSRDGAIQLDIQQLLQCGLSQSIARISVDALQRGHASFTLGRVHGQGSLDMQQASDMHIGINPRLRLVP